MDTRNIGVYIEPVDPARYRALVIYHHEDNQEDILASGLGDDPPEAVLAAALQWSGVGLTDLYVSRPESPDV